MSEPQSEWLTADEARRRLRIGRGKFYELLLDGEVPGAKRIGREWRIHWPTLLSSWSCQPLGDEEKQS